MLEDLPWFGALPVKPPQNNLGGNPKLDKALSVVQQSLLHSLRLQGHLYMQHEAAVPAQVLHQLL